MRVARIVVAVVLSLLATLAVAGTASAGHPGMTYDDATPGMTYD